MWPSSAPAPRRAAVDLAVEDQAAADPRPDGQHDHVACPAACPEEELGEGGDVRVVVDVDGEPEPLSHQIAQRDVRDLEVDGLDRHAAVVVDGGRDAQAGTEDVRPSVPGLLQLPAEVLGSLSSLSPIEDSCP